MGDAVDPGGERRDVRKLTPTASRWRDTKAAKYGYGFGQCGACTVMIDGYGAGVRRSAASSMAAEYRDEGGQRRSGEGSPDRLVPARGDVGVRATATGLPSRVNSTTNVRRSSVSRLAGDESAFDEPVEDAGERGSLVRQHLVQFPDAGRTGVGEVGEDVGLALGETMLTKQVEIEADPVRRSMNRGDEQKGHANRGAEDPVTARRV